MLNRSHPSIEQLLASLIIMKNLDPCPYLNNSVPDYLNRLTPKPRNLLLLFLLVPGDWLFKKFHQQSFGIWEFLFGGVWNARAQKGEGGTGNKLFQRLESLSDYTESKGWLEDKE